MGSRKNISGRKNLDIVQGAADAALYCGRFARERHRLHDYDEADRAVAALSSVMVLLEGHVARMHEGLSGRGWSELQNHVNVVDADALDDEDFLFRDNRRRILLVQTETDRALVDALQNADHCVLEVGDVADAVEVLAAGEDDVELVLFDAAVAGLGDLKTMLEGKSSEHNGTYRMHWVPILVATGDPEGANDEGLPVLAKPFTPAKVVAAVEACFDEEKDLLK